MRAPFMKSAAVAVVLALSTLVHAAEADAPGVAGRVSLAQGEVTLESAEGGRGAATINWPVTGGDVLRTAPGARTEVRVGSTAVRLDGDSSMEVVRLDEDTVRLRLFYGSVNVRVMNRELLDGFELSTPHGSVRMTQPGRIRVDAERAPQTTGLHVFEGVAVLSVPGSSLTVREGRSARSEAGDVLTGAAQRDGFDDWAYLRDQRDDRAPATRYVPREMTGYEELDQYGSWRESVEYGPLWAPRAVPAGWVPYRDGRWTWVAPWGWTWVDNAPWGYAPSHYGRWVMVGSRWYWAPGRGISRPVWAPALVGWVGGANWSLTFGSGGHRYMPAQGWYPLSPYDTFVPHYRARHDHVRRLNFAVRPPRALKPRHRPHGLTVVPQEHFGIRNVIEVSKLPKASAPVAALPTAQVAPPPSPLRRRPGQDGVERVYEDEPAGRYARDRRDEPRRGRRDEGDAGVPPSLRMPQPVAAQAPAAVVAPAAPAPAVQAGDDGRRFGRRFDDDRRFDREPRREREQRSPADAAAPLAPAPVRMAPAQPVIRHVPEQPVQVRHREPERPAPAPVMRQPEPVVAAAPPVMHRPEPAAAAPEQVRGRRGPAKGSDRDVER